MRFCWKHPDQSARARAVRQSRRQLAAVLMLVFAVAGGYVAVHYAFGQQRHFLPWTVIRWARWLIPAVDLPMDFWEYQYRGSRLEPFRRKAVAIGDVCTVLWIWWLVSLPLLAGWWAWFGRRPYRLDAVTLAEPHTRTAAPLLRQLGICFVLLFVFALLLQSLSFYGLRNSADRSSYPLMVGLGLFGFSLMYCILMAVYQQCRIELIRRHWKSTAE